MNFMFSLSRKLLWIVATTLILSGCVTTKEQAVYVTQAIDGPKEIALVGTRYPWVSQIESRIRNAGIKIKRFASISEATEKLSETTTETYTKATARVILVLDGFAPNTSMTRCFGGGYNFQFINAELIDAKNNETIATYANSGWSENCPPLSGTIFSDITNMVVNTFE